MPLSTFDDQSSVGAADPFTFKLPFPEAPPGYLALSKRILLTQEEAAPLLAAGKLLPVDVLDYEGTAATKYGYWLAEASAPVEDAQALLNEMRDGRRLLNCTHEAELRENRERRSLFYFGVELLRLDKSTGCLHFNRLYRPFVTPTVLRETREKICRLWVVDSLCESYGLSHHDVILTPNQVQTDTWTIGVPRRDGTFTPKLSPTAPSAVRALASTDSLIRFTLLRPDSLRARAAQFSRMIRRDLLDPEVASLTAKSVYSGSNFAFSDYNQVVAYRELYAQVHAESAVLLPMLHEFLRQHAKPGGWPTNEQRAQATAAFYALRKSARKSGALSKADWKALLSLKVSTFKTLFRFQDYPGHVDDSLVKAFLPNWSPAPALPSSLMDRLRVLRLTRAMGLPLTTKDLPEQLALFSRLLHRGPGEDLVRDTCKLLVQWAWQQAEYDFAALLSKGPANKYRRRKKSLLDHFMRIALRSRAGAHQLHQVYDWLRAEGAAQGYPKDNSTWPALCRRSDAWHVRQRVLAQIRHERERAAKDARLKKLRALNRNPNGEGWNPRFSACVLDAVRVTPLHTEEMLAIEAEEQSHCVDDYALYCWEGDTLIFSLRDDGHRSHRSTLEVRLIASNKSKSAPTWQNVQHMGPCNDVPPAHHGPVAQRICNMLNSNSAKRAA